MSQSNFIAEKLRSLTKAICEKHKLQPVAGLLGGECGYGVEFINDAFEMHPYFWGECACEKADIDHHEDGCPETRPNFKCGELEVRWYKYIGRGMWYNAGNLRDDSISDADLVNVFDRCFQSLNCEGASK